MRTIEAVFFVLTGVLLGGIAMQASTYEQHYALQNELSEVRVAALEDRTTANHLLSGGRFVRQWDVKNGHSIYTFRAGLKK